MTLKTVTCTLADLPRAVEVEKAAWADDEFTPILFPGPFPPEMAEFRSQEMARELEDDPTTRWVKVVDTDLSNPYEGVAFAQWHVYEDGFPAQKQGRSFGEGSNVEACELVFGGMAKQRDRLLGRRRCVYLQILLTDPAHNRRGAGGLLVQWGIGEAKQLGLPVYVESSRKGHGLYKKYGFEDLEEHNADLSKFGATKPHQTWAMIILPDMRDNVKEISENVATE